MSADNAINNLIGAFVTKLRTDTGSGSLVTLTGHDATKPNGYRIFASQTPTKERIPCVTVEFERSVPVVRGITALERAIFRLCAFSTDAVLSARIGSRLRKLLGTTSNTSYYDFSDTNVTIKSVNILPTQRESYKGEEGYQEYTVVCEVFWSDTPCS